jgi:hypothetical protein
MSHSSTNYKKPSERFESFINDFINDKSTHTDIDTNDVHVIISSLQSVMSAVKICCQICQESNVLPIRLPCCSQYFACDMCLLKCIATSERLDVCPFCRVSNNLIFYSFITRNGGKYDQWSSRISDTVASIKEISMKSIMYVKEYRLNNNLHESQNEIDEKQMLAELAYVNEDPDSDDEEDSEPELSVEQQEQRRQRIRERIRQSEIEQKQMLAEIEAYDARREREEAETEADEEYTPPQQTNQDDTLVLETQQEEQQQVEQQEEGEVDELADELKDKMYVDEDERKVLTVNNTEVDSNLQPLPPPATPIKKADTDELKTPSTPLPTSDIMKKKQIYNDLVNEYKEAKGRMNDDKEGKYIESQRNDLVVLLQKDGFKQLNELNVDGFSFVSKYTGRVYILIE